MKKMKQVSPSDALIDEWLKRGRKPEDVQGLLRQFTKQVVERAMQGEMAEHLGYEKHDPDGNNSGNSRNGATLHRAYDPGQPELCDVEGSQGSGGRSEADLQSGDR